MPKQSLVIMALFVLYGVLYKQVCKQLMLEACIADSQAVISDKT